MPTKERFDHVERTPDEAFAEAERRIAKASAKSDLALDLRNLGLVLIPDSIGS